MADANAKPVKKLSLAERREQKKMEKHHSLANFIRTHREQFKSMGVPQKLWKIIYAKIYHKIYDVLEAFQVQYVQDRGFRLMCLAEELKKDEDVFLLDHAWTTTHELAIPTLLQNNGLSERLWTMFDMDRRMKHEAEDAKEIALARQRLTEAAAREYQVDEEVLQVLTAETKATVEFARAALERCKGDLIYAMEECQRHMGEIVDSKETQETEARLAEMVASQASPQVEQKQPKQDAKAAETKVETEPAKWYNTTPEQLEAMDEKTQRAHLLYEAMFKYNLARSYNLLELKQNEDIKLEGAKEGAADRVTVAIYVNDEVGSSIQYLDEVIACAEKDKLEEEEDDDEDEEDEEDDEEEEEEEDEDDDDDDDDEEALPTEPNAFMHHLLVMTLGGMAFTVLWLSKDLEQGDIVTVARPTKSVLPPHTKWGTRPVPTKP